MMDTKTRFALIMTVTILCAWSSAATAASTVWGEGVPFGTAQVIVSNNILPVSSMVPTLESSRGRLNSASGISVLITEFADAPLFAGTRGILWANIEKESKAPAGQIAGVSEHSLEYQVVLSGDLIRYFQAAASSSKQLDSTPYDLGLHVRIAEVHSVGLRLPLTLPGSMRGALTLRALQGISHYDSIARGRTYVQPDGRHSVYLHFNDRRYGCRDWDDRSPCGSGYAADLDGTLALSPATTLTVHVRNVGAHIRWERAIEAEYTLESQRTVVHPVDGYPISVPLIIGREWPIDPVSHLPLTLGASLTSRAKEPWEFTVTATADIVETGAAIVPRWYLKVSRRWNEFQVSVNVESRRRGIFFEVKRHGLEIGALLDHPNPFLASSLGYRLGFQQSF